MGATGTQSSVDISANDVLRFLLELAALGALAYWGWAAHTGLFRWFWALGLPLVAAVLWGVFRVPGDDGTPVVVTPGPVRLALEAVLFSSSVGLLWFAGRPVVAVAFGALVVVHYAVGYRRIRWLLSGDAATTPRPR